MIYPIRQNVFLAYRHIIVYSALMFENRIQI